MGEKVRDNYSLSPVKSIFKRQNLQLFTRDQPKVAANSFAPPSNMLRIKDKMDVKHLTWVRSWGGGIYFPLLLLRTYPQAVSISASGNLLQVVPLGGRRAPLSRQAGLPTLLALEDLPDGLAPGHQAVV